METLTPAEELHIRQALKDIRRILATGRDIDGVVLTEEELRGHKKDQTFLLERLGAHYRAEQDECLRDRDYGTDFGHEGDWA